MTFLHQISWHQYLVAALVAAIIYYFIIILRNYRPELQSLRRRITEDSEADQLQALRYKPEEEGGVKTGQLPDAAIQPEKQEAVTDTDILAGKLKACIASAADKPFAPAILIPRLKIILKEYQHLSASDRGAINRLVASESEKTGTALLTEEQVDQWWEG
ncbi:hypothetical protein ACVW0P_002615 [Mucilaginibacter sp. UYNi724]